MRIMTRRTSFIFLAWLITSISLSQLEARPRDRAAASGAELTALVVLYDAIPGQEAALELELKAPISQSDVALYGIVNDRVLKNIDPVATQFASYTKFSGPSNSNDFLSARLDRVKGLSSTTARRIDIVQLESTFTPGHRTDSPTGKEFGYKAVGQTAHLFFGVPDPGYGQEYFDLLAQVKTLTENCSPQGWFGDDLLSSAAPRPAEQLAPYTPRPSVSTMMSINYAEYQSFEDAEDAYLNRQQSEDPTFLQLTRVFFSSLQVPSRFYIFRVVANR